MSGTSQLEQQRLLAAAMKRLTRMEKVSCFDAADLNSRPTPDQQAAINAFRTERLSVLALIGGNQSGKSALSMRILAWLFEENFPEFTRREKWGNEPLLILVVAQTLKQFEESLWRKLEPLLTDNNYHVQRVGGVISRIQNKTNGNTLLVFSHDNVNEARKRIQSFTAHVAVIDELPSKFALIEETLRRLQAKDGILLLPFTPKVPAPEIKRFVDSLKPPYGKRFKLKALDNPVYDEEQKRRILESTTTMSEAMRRTVLEGDWMTAEEAVYSLDHENVIEEPLGYHPSWRHVESSDPALSSKFGFLVAAQSPVNHCWYVVRADYIQDILVPQDMFEEVQRRVAGINLVRRISDPHETWYIQTAAKNGVTYMWPYDKARRKGELIKNLQTALGPKLRIAPWCSALVEELSSASWSQHAEGKIANSSSLHLNDCAQYLVDCLPKDSPHAVAPTWEAELRAANYRRKQLEKTKTKQLSRIQRRRR